MGRATGVVETRLAAAFLRDHGRIEALLESALADAEVASARRARSAFARFARALRAHIVIEDGSIFPAFETQTGLVDSGPTTVLRREHRAMEERLLDIQSALVDPQATRPAAAIRALRALLQDHVRREDEVLYPVCDRLLDPRSRARVARRLSRRRWR